MESRLAARRLPFFVKGDLDGLFGLFVDNLVQLLLIVSLCSTLCGMRQEESYLIYKFILPGAAVSILIGNLFYAWQARRLAAQSGRRDVTALPYGINTPSLLVYIFFVMLPVYRTTGSAKAAWQIGLAACLGSGVIELAGAFVAEAVRKHTPRAALLSCLAGIAITFISMTFALQIWQRPLVAMLPLAVILVTYFAQVSFPFGLPGGLVAIAGGTLLAWLLPQDLSGISLSAEEINAGWKMRTIAWPNWAGPELWDALKGDAANCSWLNFLSVIIPMGLFNVAGSLQNIESAEAAGDKFQTRPSLAINGAGTIAAALCGSCFPTTIYIGHPGWKALGARAGYSSLNGLLVAGLCCTGTISLVASLIPIEACVPIVLWIGIIITAQAFQTTPAKHAPAAALGLFPAIAGWGAAILSGAFALCAKEGSPTPAMTIQDVLTTQGLDAQANGFLVHGLNLMSQGYIFSSMVIAAMTVCLIEREFLKAAVWSLVGAICSFVGLTHAYQIRGNITDFLFIGTSPAAGATAYPANGVACGYLLMALVFVAAQWRQEHSPTKPQVMQEKQRCSRT